MKKPKDIPSYAYLQQHPHTKEWWWVEDHPHPAGGGHGSTEDIRKATEEELTEVIHERYKR